MAAMVEDTLTTEGEGDSPRGNGQGTWEHRLEAKAMRSPTRTEHGSILVAVLFMVVLVAAFCLSSILMSQADSRQADFLVHRTQALYVAQAGVEDLVRELSNMRSASPIDDPFVWYNSLADKTLRDGTWLTKDGVSAGQYDVSVSQVNTVDTSTRDLVVQATGWVPSRDHVQAVERTIDAVIRVSVGRSEVFDYVYFINNWGWYYGNTIIANGNVRGNGQFDGGGYQAYVNAIPRFDKLEGTDFTGYKDDGGIFAGWNIVGASNMRGDANALWTQADCDAGKCQPEDVDEKKCQHSYQDKVPMPNLSDLNMYENLAKEKASYIKIGDDVIVTAVQGDDAGEKQHLYLRGTPEEPIEIHGPVVVRGCLIISGVVKGQGAIYSGGNVYVPQNLTYETPPGATPTDPTEADMEAWIAANQNADALGLFAREHVVIGDYTNSQWQYYVNSWRGDHRNKSEEDAGEDDIPNTKNGRDGIGGTADDDLLEDDDTWTVQYYTTMHEGEGLIPEGKRVGDPIPGTGEDIDGDGQYDSTCQMNEFNLPMSLSSVHWAGNTPPEGTQYTDIASCDSLTRLDAAFYTNHHFAMLTLAWGQDMVFNGCIVSRNESIIYGTDTLQLNYDYRLLGEGESHGFFLPKVWAPVEIVYWAAN